MRINSETPPGVIEQKLVEQNKTADAARVKQEGVSGTTSVDDATQLTLAQDSVRSARVNLEAEPAVRTSKVQALQDAINNGTYKVDTEKLADAMVRELL